MAWRSAVRRSDHLTSSSSDGGTIRICQRITERLLASGMMRGKVTARADQAAASTALPSARPAPSAFFALDLLDNRFPALHGMRVIAILTVIAYHVTWIFGAEQGIELDPDFF